MHSGKCAKFLGLIASISIKRKLCDLFLNQTDVFVNLPTGFGKSVVFQALPLVYSCVDPTRKKNIVLVVSPLMKDQVSRLNSSGVSANIYNGYLSNYLMK